jgi:hypothetical protein
MLLFRFIISVIISLSSLKAATEIPADFQEDLYRRYFPVGGSGKSALEGFCEKYLLPTAASDNAWEDFCAQPRGVTSVEEPQQLIVSLTSYPARMGTTWLATESLLRQDTKPTMVILNLFEGEFPGRKLPSTIEKQMARGLEIRWHAENLRVYLKVLPTIKSFNDALVVAVDDDIIYDRCVLTDLMAGYRKYPNCVIARDVREIKVRNGKVLPVPYWIFTETEGSYHEIDPSTNLVPEGLGGMLFPPHIFHKDLHKKEIFSQLCPTDDDVWYYTMAVANETKVVKIPTASGLKFIRGTQQLDTALWRTNSKDHFSILSQTFERVFVAYNLGRFLNANQVSVNLNGEWEGFILNALRIIKFINYRGLEIFEMASIGELLQAAYMFLSGN